MKMMLIIVNAAIILVMQGCDDSDGHQINRNLPPLAKTNNPDVEQNAPTTPKPTPKTTTNQQPTTTAINHITPLRSAYNDMKASADILNTMHSPYGTKHSNLAISILNDAVRIVQILKTLVSLQADANALSIRIDAASGKMLSTKDQNFNWDAELGKVGSVYLDTINLYEKAPKSLK